MVRTSRVLLLVAVSTVGACSVTQDPGYTGRPRRTDSSGSSASSGRWGDAIVVEGDAIASWIKVDTDGGQPQPSQTFAPGYGLRAASGDKDQSIGLLYQGLFAEADAFDLNVLGLDVKVRTPLDSGPHKLYVTAGGGFGWAWLDETFGGEVRNDAEGQLRVGLEYQATESFALTASGGGLGIGHIGDTGAWGTFLTFGAVLVF